MSPERNQLAEKRELPSQRKPDQVAIPAATAPHASPHHGLPAKATASPHTPAVDHKAAQ